MFPRIALAIACCLPPILSPAAAPILDVQLTLTGCDEFDCDPVTRTRRTLAEGAAAFNGAEDRKDERFRSIQCCGIDEIFGGGRALGHASASARPGELRLDASAELRSFGSGQAFATMRSEARASFTLRDVIILGPGPFVSGAIPIAFEGELNVGAAYLTTAERRGAGLSQASSTVSIDASFNNAGAGGSVRLFRNVLSDGTLIETISDRGLLEGYDGGRSVLLIPVLNAPTNQPLAFTLAVTLDAVGVASHVEGFQGFAEADLAFGETISLMSDGPAFLLPDGFTANSVDGRIVDNRWMGVADAVSAPEPGAAGLLAAACLAFFGRRTILRRDSMRQEAVRCAARCRPWPSRSRRSSPS